MHTNAAFQVGSRVDPTLCVLCVSMQMLHFRFTSTSAFLESGSHSHFQRRKREDFTPSASVSRTRGQKDRTSEGAYSSFLHGLNTGRGEQESYGVDNIVLMNLGHAGGRGRAVVNLG